MKYNLVDEPVFITSCKLIPSRWGGDVWSITFKGIKTQDDYHTYVDPQNTNFRNWDHIISVANLKGIVLTNLKLKNNKDQVNADSNPTIEAVVPQEELAQKLADYWEGTL